MSAHWQRLIITLEDGQDTEAPAIIEFVESVEYR